MIRYLTKRLLLAIPTILGVTAAAFLLTHLVPGGPVERAMFQASGAGGQTIAGHASALPAEAIAELRQFYGFDRPLPERYAHWLWSALNLDLGRSYVHQRPVWEVINERLHVTVLLGCAGFLLAYLLAVPLGIAKAVKRGSPFDAITSLIVFAGYSLPAWALGTLLLMLLGGGSGWNLLPLGGYAFDVPHLFLPTLCYAAGTFPAIVALTDRATGESLTQDYVRAALARGASPWRAVVCHATRNSLIPVVSGFGRAGAVIVSGSFLIERVFNIDGAGYLGYTSALQHDYPVALGLVLVAGLAMVIGNCVSDMFTAALDPRVRHT